ncbi:Scr1 family TA system antitoxin-like transcriptional regulator [Streptomyces coeruleorubidus]|uniref:Scr1 family TA system antitoxin-like transcriptional regulator n=1 Tax=Streptomyces coeruleorubidus TaxID=116188 RepID=UPI0033C8B919
MVRQLEHLHKAALSPDIDVQVLPFSAGAHAAGAGHFVILGRDDEREPLNSMAVVYIEMRRRGLYLDDAEDVGAYKLTFDYLRPQAADTTSSLRLIAGARQELSS